MIVLFEIDGFADRLVFSDEDTFHLRADLSKSPQLKNMEIRKPRRVYQNVQLDVLHTSNLRPVSF